MHPFLSEIGYQALAEDSEVRAEEVKYLLSLKDPDIALKQYCRGKKYLEHLPCRGDLNLNFKGKYQSYWFRKGYQCACYALYFLIAVPTGLLFLFPDPALSQTPAAVFFIFVIWPLFCLVVIESIFKQLRGMEAAQTLVKNQAKHKQYIVVTDVLK
jgi:hypothetical protein